MLIHPGFRELVARGVTTGCTRSNQASATPLLTVRRSLDAAEQELLFDPQTSGGLLLSVPAPSADALLQALLEGGHRAADIGDVTAGEPGVEIA